jgi:signal transduction histidine kinase
MKDRRVWFAGLLLVVSIALLVGAGMWYTAGYGLEPTEASAHLTQADWQVTQTTGMTTPASAVDSRALPQAWKPTTLPHAFLPTPQARASAADLPANTIGSVTWIRVPVQIPASLHSGPLMLYGSRIKTDGTIAIYADGRLVYRAQQQGPLWDSLFAPLWVELDRRDGAPPLNEILIRLEHTRATDVVLTSLWLGTADALQARYIMRRWLQRELPATLSTAFLLVGTFALFVWFRRRHETGYLLFFNLAATSFVAHLHYYVSLPINNDWFAWLTINGLFWLIVVVHFFLCQMHGRSFRWLTWSVVGVTGTITVLTLPVVAVLPVLPNTPVIVPLIYAVAIVMAAVVGGVGIVAAWRYSWEARLVAAGVGVCTLLGVSDWLMYNNVVSGQGWFLGAYMNAVTFGMFGTLIYRRYVNAIVEVEQLNVSLAQQLQQREAELEESHRLLREAERRRTISDERRRLMQDMHDGLGSSLISAIRSVERGDSSGSKVSGILKSCLDDLKLTIDSMEPVEADLLLLLATLRFRLEPRLEGTGTALRWDVQKLPTLSWLDPSSALHILRIVQESIANILAHTRASEIRVSTAADAAGVEVIVEDNGQGFDVERALSSGKGHGLRNQQRRARAVDGTVKWVAGAHGTRFTLRLPLQRNGERSAMSV